jgi:hypothetical protein
MELVTCGKINEGAGKNVNKKINDFTFVDIDLSLFTDDLTNELPSGVCVCARARACEFMAVSEKKDATK